MRRLIFLGMLLLCVPLSAKTVRLITIGPGDEFWSAFGHTAIAIDQDVYGFGYFSFEQEGLIKAFIDNQMYYDLGLSELNEEVQLAEWQNRSFMVQQLKLGPQQTAVIEAHLQWHMLPENQSYHYDYFINNCSTKIRDLLDDVWQGSLKQTFDQHTELNYYQLTIPARQQSWMNLGMALVYGWDAYSPRTAWELMAFPEYFYAAIESSWQHELQQSAVIYEQKPMPGWQNLLGTHGAVLGILSLGLLLLAFPLTRRLMAATLMVTQSLIGCILVMFWMISGYQLAEMNFNLLLFVPVAFVIFSHRSFSRVLLICYVLWAICALYLGAWYLMPFLVLHVLSVLVLKNQRHSVFSQQS